jgi:hypothetical protein
MTKWVYRMKNHANGTLIKLKVQLIAKRFQQQQGQDFEETYAQVAKYNSLQTLSAISSQKNCPFFHLDVKTTFLNGKIKEDVYIQHH